MGVGKCVGRKQVRCDVDQNNICWLSRWHSEEDRSWAGTASENLATFSNGQRTHSAFFQLAGLFPFNWSLVIIWECFPKAFRKRVKSIYRIILRGKLVESLTKIQAPLTGRAECPVYFRPSLKRKQKTWLYPGVSQDIHVANHLYARGLIGLTRTHRGRTVL